MHSVLHAPLNFLKKPRYALESSDSPLRIEQIFFIDRFDVGVHKVRRQYQF
jgi:hypothetical protein